jgi:hypothetical protein
VPRRDHAAGRLSPWTVSMGRRQAPCHSMAIGWPGARVTEERSD